MFSGLYILVPFRKAKVNDKDGFNFLPFANHEVISLDITMDKPLTMDLFQSSDDLNTNVNCGSKAEPFLALLIQKVPELEEVLQGI
jgi:hypothetical protein